MIENTEMDLFVKAEEKFKTPSVSVRQILNSCSDYSTEKKLKKARELQIPYDLRNYIVENDKAYESGKTNGIRYGVLEEINTLYVIHDNTLYLYSFLSSYKNVLPFSENVLFVRCLKPKASIFQKKILTIILVVTQTKLFFFCVKEGEDGFFEVKIEHTFTEALKDIKVNDDSRIFAITKYDVMEVKYDMYGCTSHNPDVNFFEYFMPILFLRRKISPIVDFDVKNNFLVTLTRNEIVVYALSKFKKINVILTCRTYQKIGIVEEDGTNVVVNNKLMSTNVLICAVGCNGERDYYDSTRLLFSRECPLKTKDTDRFEVQGTNFVVHSSDKNVLVVLNDDQLYNFDKKRAAENYEITGNGRLFCGKRMFLVSDTVIVYEHLKGPEYLLSTKNTYRAARNYGQIVSLFYLLIKADNRDTNSFDCSFSQIDRNFVYLAVVHIIQHFYRLPIRKIYLIDLDVAIRKLRNINEYDAFVKKVIGCLNFVKIAVDYQCTYIMDMSVRDLLLNKYAEKRKKSLESINLLLLKNKCADFLSLNDLFYNSALNLIKRGSREALARAVDDLLNCDVEHSIFQRILDAKYYLGAVKLLKKMKLGYEERVQLLCKSLLCQNALLEALDDPREDFVYAVFDAFLRNKSRFNDCLCCDEKCDDMNIISLSSPFLESFLREKFYESDNKEEFDLYWKFLIYKKRQSEGVKCINTLIDIKQLTLEHKIEYLTVVSAFDQSNKTKLQIAKLQYEIANRMKTAMDTLLDAQTLFNEYAYPNGFYDIALKLLDLCDCEKEVIFDVMLKYLKGPASEIEGKLAKLHLKGSCHNISVILTIFLSKKLSDELNVCNMLNNLNYNKDKIVETIRKELKYNVSPDVKKYLAKCIRSTYGMSENEINY
ncbi:Nuclear pore complex, Nup155 component (D Nup154, sc Nup157/Nup170) [Trachipleistophora hominis]|uniref:Nuclear pore complex, Nup155 component (D Nup154, sc Nup157/Nup170) n=1 Tax=Trachipleistophora hominis TaxID=72359 RepID=L7JSP9_TRAHO|nr:Nuclear pore complex, Nup155 component (D Nup154, sc Nup157/Nup170) [Trachipleistophora hominis]